MEHETPVPEFAERPRARPVRRSEEPASSELSRPDQTAIAGAAVAPPTALRSSVIGLQRTAGNAAVAALLEQSLAESEDREETSPVLDVVGKGRGQPLDPGLRDEMEIRLGEDFSDVRIHSDAPAAASAAAVSARAYTVGNEVVLGNAAPALDTPDGKRTLAHELTHVVQQRQGPVAGTPTGSGIAISDPSDRFEQAAEANAERAMANRIVDDGPARGSGDAGGAVMSMQREPADVEDYEEEADEYQEEAAEYQEEAAEYQEEAAEATEEGAEAQEEELEEGGEEEEEEEEAAG